MNDHIPLGVCWLLAIIASASTPQAYSLDQSVSRIGGDLSRDLLGDGTNVVVAVIDSGIDDSHPALSGNDSLGRPRMFAERNFVPGQGATLSNDLHGHGTGVAGVIASRDDTHLGLAPDVRLINARALDANNRFDVSSWPENAAGWAIDQGAQVMNLSLNFFATSSDSSAGAYTLDRMLDWAAYDSTRRVSTVVCNGNIQDGAGGLSSVRSPGGAYNVITVGQTGPLDYGQLSADSSRGPTSNGRSKPDLVAPGANITTTRRGGRGFSNWNGCSFAAPHVAGVLAQMTDYGQTHDLSTDPIVLKALLLTGAEKVQNHLGESWQPGNGEVVEGVWRTTAPLDPATGAGQIHALASAEIYRAGHQAAGLVAPLGWNSTTIAHSDFVEYQLDIPAHSLRTGRTQLSSTLNWMRHVRRVDSGNGQVDALDQFYLNEPDDVLDNLDLTLLFEGQPIAISSSVVDNVEHLYWPIESAGRYTLRVDRKEVAHSGTDERMAIAWALLGAAGDVNLDGVLSLSDVTLIQEAILREPGNLEYDINEDQRVDATDMSFWIVSLKRTYMGDANLDGEFNAGDLVLIFQAGQFEDANAGNSNWSSGDWNSDGEFTSSDLVQAFQDGGYERGTRPAIVPEPSSLAIVLLALGIRVMRTGRNGRGGTRRCRSPLGFGRSSWLRTTADRRNRSNR